jgi:hypothetical protein
MAPFDGSQSTRIIYWFRLTTRLSNGAILRPDMPLNSVAIANVFKVIRHHAAMSICILLSALALVLYIAAGKTFKDELETQFRRETRNIAELLISHFDATVLSLDELLLQVASEYSSIEANSSNKLQQLQEILKQHAPHGLSSPISLITISDKNGMVIATDHQYRKLAHQRVFRTPKKCHESDDL